MRLLLIAAVAAAFSPAYAITGNDALRQARTPGGETAVLAYMRGTMEVESIMRVNTRQLAATGSTPAFAAYCAPEGATADQGWAVVSKFLNDHPEMSHHELGVLARTALLGAWPCR